MILESEIKDFDFRLKHEDKDKIKKYREETKNFVDKNPLDAIINYTNEEIYQDNELGRGSFIRQICTKKLMGTKFGQILTHYPNFFFKFPELYEYFRNFIKDLRNVEKTDFKISFQKNIIEKNYFDKLYEIRAALIQTTSCYFPEYILPIYKIDFLLKFVKELGLEIDLPLISRKNFGESLLRLNDLLVNLKLKNAILKNWDNLALTHFLFEIIDYKKTSNDIKVWFGATQPPNPKENIPEPNKRGEKRIMFEKIMGENKEQGYYSFGWQGFQEDMNIYSDKDLKTLLIQIVDTKSGNLWSNERIEYHFRIKNEMKKGDLVIARKGGPKKRIYGIGVISSDYNFEENFDPFGTSNTHYRKVKWYINFYHDYRSIMDDKNYFYQNYYIDLIEEGLFPYRVVFPTHTLPKYEDLQFYLKIKEGLIKKFKILLNDKKINQEQLDNYLEAFNKLEDDVKITNYFQLKKIINLSKKANDILNYFKKNTNIK